MRDDPVLAVIFEVNDRGLVAFLPLSLLDQRMRSEQRVIRPLQLSVKPLLIVSFYPGIHKSYRDFHREMPRWTAPRLFCADANERFGAKASEPKTT